MNEMGEGDSESLASRRELVPSGGCYYPPEGTNSRLLVRSVFHSLKTGHSLGLL